jgi:antitoxin Phd
MSKNTFVGVETAVLVPMREWRNLRERVRPSLKTLLLAPKLRGEFNVPPPGRLRRRNLSLLAIRVPFG